MILRLRIERKAFRTHDGDRPVLGRIELMLGAREVVGIAGPSGCGKTTLLRIIAGLETNFEGTLAWRGSNPPRIGMVFQDPRLLPWRTVRHNLLLAQSNVDADLVDEMLRAMDLASFRNAYPRTLSLGMARRVALARALVVRPDVMLLDEPFASLDAATAMRTRELLVAAWRSRPTAAVLVTHDLAEASSLAGRILLLGDQPTRIQREIAGSPSLLRD